MQVEREEPSSERSGTGGRMMAPMEVYLVPLGPDRHELYCELTDEPVDVDPEDEAGGRGWFPGLRSRFREMIAVAEAEQRGDVSASDAVVDRGWARRVRDRVVGAVAEAIVEQRLLWNLRRQTDAVLVRPRDLTEARAVELMRAALRRDAEKHRLWLGVDLLAFVASGLLALIPGPNLIAYYFAFRLVGHFLSLRGARHGLDGVRWTARASESLADVRAAVALPPTGRTVRLRELSERLELRHLAAFVERVALVSA